MPKIAKTERERRACEFKVTVVTALMRCGFGRKELARRMGYKSYTPLYLRLNDPEMFSLGELYRLSNILNISLTTLLGITKEAS